MYGRLNQATYFVDRLKTLAEDIASARRATIPTSPDRRRAAGTGYRIHLRLMFLRLTANNAAQKAPRAQKSRA